MEDYLLSIYFDEPVAYKDLLIHPVTMRQYVQFHYYSSCLLIDKNSISDINVISMSYLKFLYYVAVDGDNNVLYMLKMLLCLVLMKSESEIKFYIEEKNDKACFKVGDSVYTSEDFDKIVEIIMTQNQLTPIDETVQKEIRDAFEQAEKFKARQNTNKIGTLEEQMICVAVSTSLKLKEIYQLPIRKFEMMLKRVDAKLHYEIYLSASMSGFVTFKDDNAIKHWMNSLDENRFDKLKVDVDTIKNKVDSVNAS